MTFDLGPTDLKINRGHLLTKDYLPTKFEASWAKHSWVISCTRLKDTDIPTDRPTYRPTGAKQYAPPFSKGGIIKWPGNDLSFHIINCPYWKTETVRASITLKNRYLWNTNVPFPNRLSIGLTLDLNINRDHLLIKDYLPTKYEDSGAKRSRVISAQGVGDQHDLDLLTWILIGIIYSWRTIYMYLPSLKLLGQSVLDLSVAQGVGDRHIDRCKAICPYFFQRGHDYDLLTSKSVCAFLSCPSVGVWRRVFMLKTLNYHVTLKFLWTDKVIVIGILYLWWCFYS